MPFKIVSSCQRLPAPRRVGRARRLACLSVMLGLIPSTVRAQAFEAVGTRAQGMGGAFVAVADDATAVYWNPAGLATGAMVDIQWGLQFLDTIDAPGQPLNPGEAVSRGTSRLIALGVPALGLSYYRLHEAGAAAPTVGAPGSRETGSGGGLQVDAFTTRNFGITLLQSVADGVVVGATVRVVRGMVASGTASGVALPDEGLDAADALTGRARTTLDVDAGAMASFGVVRVGIVARNLREPVFGLEAGSGGVTLRRQVRVGVAIVPRSQPTGTHGPFTVSVDADLTRNDGPRGVQRNVAAGIERWWAGGRLGARAGVRANTLGPRRPVAAAGISIGVRRSTFVEGQLTQGRAASDRSWGMATTVTF